MTCIRSRHGTAVPMRAADAEVIRSAQNAFRLRADDSATERILSSQRITWPSVADGSSSDRHAMSAEMVYVLDRPVQPPGDHIHIAAEGVPAVAPPALALGFAAAQGSDADLPIAVVDRSEYVPAGSGLPPASSRRQAAGGPLSHLCSTTARSGRPAGFLSAKSRRFS